MTVIDLFRVLLASSCFYALLRGGSPERYAAIMFLAGYAAGLAVVSPLSTRFIRIEFLMMLVDVAMLAGFIWLAFKAERFWTLWLCAMQFIQVLTHFPIIFIPELLPRAYGVLVAIWALPMMALVVIGTFRHQQRLKLYGTDRSWSKFSP